MNDIQIRIAAALDKGDFTAAQGEVEKLKAAGTDSLNTTAAASGKIAQANQQISGSASAAIGSMSALQMLLRGNVMGAVMQLTRSVQGLSTAFSGLMAKASPVAIVGAIAYGVGTLADKFLNLSGIISRTLQPAITSMKEGWDRAFTSADKLANLRLGGLKKEIQDVVDALNQTTKETNLEKRLSDRERAARAQADVAQIEASTPAGPERDRAVLARRRQAEEEQRTADEAALKTLNAAQQKAQQDLARLKAQSEAEMKAEQAKLAARQERAKSSSDSTILSWDGGVSIPVASTPSSA